jgi:signal transduction histidine kinase
MHQRRFARLELLRRASAVQAHRIWVRLRGALIVSTAVFVGILLWRSGYPAWRLVSLGALFGAVLVIPILAGLEMDSPPCRSPRRRHDWATQAVLGSILLMVGLTGGLRSPFMIWPPAVFFMVMLRYGWSRTARKALGLMAVATAAMALLPQTWLGPALPADAFTSLVVWTLGVSIALDVGYVVALMKSMVADRASLDRAREQLMAQACTRARELERVGAELSHELKNPLQAIKILVQLAARRAAEPEVREQLKVVEGEVDRMHRLIREHLSFSRPFDKLEPEPVALGTLADDVVAVLGARASSAGVALRRRGEARAEADPRRLREALHNLVSNAIEASPRGTSVEVEIAEVGGSARITVRDEGRGMPPETLQRLGTPFFTTREEGTGLGVVLAGSALRQHGGTLTYDSEPGRGTVAVATLPLHRHRTAGSIDGAFAHR